MINKLKIPPLENGDRLSRYEFELRYQAMSKDYKAELIEGKVYMASPLRFESHAEPHSKLIIWLGNYQIVTPEVRLGIEPTIRLDLDNEPQPDAALFLNERVGGKSKITVDDYIEGTPELVVEIATSTAGYDLHEKKRVYRRNQIQEYIVWQVFENKIDWFVLNNDEYVSLAADEKGIVRSQIFPGLWLAVDALLAGDMRQVLAVLQTGLQSPEYAPFVEHLTINY